MALEVWRLPGRLLLTHLNPASARRRRRAGARLRPGDAGVGAAADFSGGPVPVPGGEAAPGRVNKAHAE